MSLWIVIKINAIDSSRKRKHTDFPRDHLSYNDSLIQPPLGVVNLCEIYLSLLHKVKQCMIKCSELAAILSMKILKILAI